MTVTEGSRSEGAAAGRRYGHARWIAYFGAAVALFLVALELSSDNWNWVWQGGCLILSAVAFKRFVSEGVALGHSRTWMRVAYVVAFVLTFELRFYLRTH